MEVNFSKFTRQIDKIGVKLNHLVRRGHNESSPPTTPPTTPRNEKKAKVHKTPIKHRKVKKSSLIIEAQNPLDSMEKTLKAILNAVDGGRSASEIIPLLHTLCEEPDGFDFERVAILDQATTSLINRLREESVTLLTQIKKSDKIPRSTAADELYISLTYNKMREAVKTTQAYKNRGNKEGLGQVYENVSQETAVKTLLVLNELMADYAKIDTNRRHGGSREHLSVMSKPYMVDQIFADAAEVFGGDSSQVMQQVAQYQLAWPPIPAKAHILNIETMNDLEKEAHIAKTLSPFVVGKYQPNFKRAIFVIQIGPTPQHATEFKEVIIEWSKKGSIKNLRHALPDVSELSAEELEKLRLANVLGFSGNYALPMHDSPQATAHNHYAPAVVAPVSAPPVNQASMFAMNPKKKKLLEKDNSNLPIELSERVTATLNGMGVATFRVKLARDLVRVVEIVWTDMESEEIFSMRQLKGTEELEAGEERYRDVSFGVIKALEDANILLKND